MLATQVSVMLVARVYAGMASSGDGFAICALGDALNDRAVTLTGIEISTSFVRVVQVSMCVTGQHWRVGQTVWACAR